MSDDMVGIWDAMKDTSKEKRARNRQNGPALLTEAGIPFESKNNGAHLIVGPQGHIFDYWPGTGYWKSRETGISRRGVKNLITRIKRELSVEGGVSNG